MTGRDPDRRDHGAIEVRFDYLVLRETEGLGRLRRNHGDVVPRQPVSGFGSSCSHPLFANRPSYTAASGTKWISSPPFFAGAGDGGGTAPDAFIVFGGNAVSAITPLWTYCPPELLEVLARGLRLRFPVVPEPRRKACAPAAP